MHSHDRTLLASLAFGDKDKRNSLHGLACRYITEKEQALRLLSMCMPTKSGWSWTFEGNHYFSKHDSGFHRVDREPNPGYAFRREIFSNPVPKFIRRSLEHPINKGANQYMTTIGFLDGMVNFGFEWTKTVTGKHWIEADGPYEQFHQNESPPGALVEIQPVVSTEDYGGCRIMVEVKIESVDVDEVLRQVRLYQQYLGTDRSHDGMEQFWVLVVRFDTSPGYRSALEEHGIKIAQLSAKFDEWVAALKNAGASAADEV